MLHFINFVSENLEKKHHSLAIFCDLRKAFDCCDHNILLRKLDKLGIKDTELLWFRNYLTNRRQFVSISDKKSSALPVIYGVPQGSILGPILFLLYINDLPYCSKFLTLLFADDTTLLLSNPDINVLILEANREFHKIVTFFRAHKLALHPAKTKFMIFSNNNAVKNMNPVISINFNNFGFNDENLIYPIEQISQSSEVKSLRFLGVYFDANLNFVGHVKTITSKLSKALYILRTSKNILTQQSLKSIYYSLFHCHIVYCLPIWSCTTLNVLKSIEKMQKSAIRILSNATYNAHTEPLFKKLNILPLRDLIKFFNLQLMQRYVQGFLPISFNNVWLTN
jgi:hypothetical protein